MNSLPQNILATIAYYDVLDYPLTIFELWKYLISDPAYAEAPAGRQHLANSEPSCAEASAGKQEKKKILLLDIINELENEELKKRIETYRGHYFLSGRKNLVAQRLERNKVSEKKYKIVRRAVWFLRFAPFVRGIAVAGRLAMKNASNKSDLDLFIVLKRKYIFTGRFFVTLIAQLLGIRRHGNKIANRVCLNHFITDEFNVNVKDIFSAHEYAFMVPIFQSEKFLEFYQKNSWIGKYKINYLPDKSNLKVNKDSFISQKMRNFSEKCLSFPATENFLQKIQTEKIAENSLTRKKGAMIICSSDELAFWPNFENQGPRVFETFKEKMEGLTKF